MNELDLSGGDGEVRDGDGEADGAGDRQRDEPDPEDDEDLLVDDVLREDAEGVLFLDGAGGTVLREVALGDPDQK